MKNIIEQLSIPVFYGYTLVFQPLFAYLVARYLTRRWALRGYLLQGWVAGLGVVVGVFLLWWLAIYLRLQLTYSWYGICVACHEYSDYYLTHFISGGLSLVIFILSAIWQTRQDRPTR